MEFTSRKKLIVVLANFFLVVNAAIHLAYAGTHIDWGNYLESLTSSSQLYNDVLPTASFIIIVAILLIINSLVSYTNLLVSGRQSVQLANFSWTCCWLLVVLNFAAGVLSANSYSRTTQVFNQYPNLTTYLSIQFNNQYRCSLADAIITFLLGFPSTMVLMHLENYHRAKFIGVGGGMPRRESEMMQAQATQPVQGVAVQPQIVVFEEKVTIE